MSDETSPTRQRDETIALLQMNLEEYRDLLAEARAEELMLAHNIVDYKIDIAELTDERNAAIADALHYKAIAESLVAEREQHGYGLPRCAVCDMWLGDDIHKGFDGELCHQSCCTMCGDNPTHDRPPS